jgi:hypothetical protein
MCYIETNLCFLKMICTGVQQQFAPPSLSPLSPVSTLSLFLSLAVCMSLVEHTDWRKTKGRGRSQARKPGPL